MINLFWKQKIGIKTILKKQNTNRKNLMNKTKKKNVYPKNKGETDNKFRLISSTRKRIYKSLKGKTKQSSTKDILGIDKNLYRKWIEWQMTPEMNGTNIEIDHVKALSLFDVSKDEDLKEAFSRKNTQPFSSMTISLRENNLIS